MKFDLAARDASQGRHPLAGLEAASSHCVEGDKCELGLVQA
jgi:hypothetical protein